METPSAAPRPKPARSETDPVAEIAGLCGVARQQGLARIAADAGVPFVGDVPHEVAPELCALLPAATARALGAVPWRRAGGRVEVFLLDPADDETRTTLSFALHEPVQVVFGDPVAVTELMRRTYPEPVETFSADDTAAQLEARATSEPVVRFVATVLERAVRERASDLHFEPWSDGLVVRCRVDGVLREFARGSGELAAAAVSRIKVLAELDVAERRRPQDGRLRMQVDGREIDLRVATLPTQDGESAVLRVLDPANAGRGLHSLTMPGPVLERLRGVLARPSGLVVVTGPTGSGKTSTLYACLRELNRRDRKILTIEDPVEYEIDGATQVAAQPGIGLTFAAALRSFLRQDPDILMVGEIRDRETAQIAAQAALTGHLVLATLHTNDAPGAVLRLIDLGVEPFLVASTVTAVLAQRLVRRICEDCRCVVSPPAAWLADAGIGAADGAGITFSAGNGCASCGGTGFRGRVGIFEWFEMNEATRDALVRGTADRGALRATNGLRRAGWDAVRAGITTLDEVLQATGA